MEEGKMMRRGGSDDGRWMMDEGRWKKVDERWKKSDRIKNDVRDSIF